ncbi:MAG: linear amide C-N hydrolase, partial [Synergistaceae bacterium]|nr:linear amide C-N hydrolase [Synergistaceae bacterium]
HLMVTDKSGSVIVVEYIDGKLKVSDNPVKVLTNAPSFDWHLTNLRNYINLSVKPYSAKKIGSLNIEPLGGGSGLLGMPGDITPPSRFIRAVAQTMLARRTPDGPETIYEIFRIMDNFNQPLASGEGTVTALQDLDGMRSSTLWTSAIDTGNLVYYYHTQHNRKVRMIDLKKIDFSPAKSGIKHLPLDRVKQQEIEDITPQ